jgi:hypothetical protein
MTPCARVFTSVDLLVSKKQKERKWSPQKTHETGITEVIHEKQGVDPTEGIQAPSLRDHTEVKSGHKWAFSLVDKN